jgi:hypothetical protein
VLIGYGFVPTAQPISNFGRIYAGKSLDSQASKDVEKHQLPASGLSVVLAT